MGPATLAVGAPGEVDELVLVRLGMKPDLKITGQLFDRFQALDRDSALRIISRNPPDLSRVFHPIFSSELLNASQLLGLAVNLQNPVKARMLIKVNPTKNAADLARNLRDNPQQWLRLPDSQLLLYSQLPEIQREGSSNVELRFAVPEDSARLLLERLAKTDTPDGRGSVLTKPHKCDASSTYVPLLAGMAIGAGSIDANADGPLVDIRSVEPTIMVELRYAGTNNLVRHPLYPQDMRAARTFGGRLSFGSGASVSTSLPIWLKIWDAYRPVAVQAQLWEASHNSDYVADPEIGVGSLHSWGIAVDATLVDSWNRPVSMPSDFDDFTPAAMWRYMGPSNEILGHLRLLQNAMHRAGFWGMRTEWWHFTIARLAKISVLKKHGTPRTSANPVDGQL